MKFALKLSTAIDKLNERIGQGVNWLVLVMIFIGAFNAIARYLGREIGINLSSNAYLEAQWYIFSLIFLLGAAYTLKRDAHVRVDVLYETLNPRKQAGLNLAGTILFLMPFCLLIIWSSWGTVRDSWAIRENSPDPEGLLRYPLKTVIPIAFALLLHQAYTLD